VAHSSEVCGLHILESLAGSPGVGFSSSGVLPILKSSVGVRGAELGFVLMTPGVLIGMCTEADSGRRG
jgi:hypothetical protein